MAAMRGGLRCSPACIGWTSRGGIVVALRHAGRLVKARYWPPVQAAVAVECGIDKQGGRNAVKVSCSDHNNNTESRQFQLSTHIALLMVVVPAIELLRSVSQ